MVLGSFIYLNTKEDNYSKVFARIEKGNLWIEQNGWSDSCDSYRYYHRGCYYKQYPGLDGTDAIVGGSLQYYNLTHEEIWDLCSEFIFPGHVAYCYNQNAQTKKEKQECLDFVGTDDYLKRICMLKEDQVIPSESFGPSCEWNALPSADLCKQPIESRGYPYSY